MAKAITNHLFGLQQFVIGKPIWETYLKGEEPDPTVAMQKVVDAVHAEMQAGLAAPCADGRSGTARAPAV